MSRTAVLGFVVAAAGLSGCAGPAKLVMQDSTKVVVAVPDDSNGWPGYYEDEARKKAGEYIHDPVKVSSERVKVGEQTTSTQDVTRRDLTGKDKPVEVVTAQNSTSTADKYEYHLTFQSRGSAPLSGSSMPPLRDVPPPPNPTGPPLGSQGPTLVPAGGIPKSPTPVEDGKPYPITPPPGVGAVPPPTGGNGPTSLPPTVLTVPGVR